MESTKIMCAKVVVEDKRLVVKASCNYLIDGAEVLATKVFGN